jgi:hypothetical protein
VEANKVTDVAWRKDDFEERGIDSRMFASGTANTRIVEEKSLWNPGATDLVWIQPNGKIILIESKVDPKRAEKFATIWAHWQNVHRPDRDRFVSFKWCANAPLNDAIVLSRLLIDEPPCQVQSNSAVSSSEIDQPPQQLAAIHPVTKLVYDQLRNISESYRKAIARILTQFVNFVPQTDSSKFPPLRLATLEDSSYLLEWTFQDRRLGFTFETDPKESGWYFVLLKTSSYQSESGTMDRLEMDRLIRMMIQT